MGFQGKGHRYNCIQSGTIANFLSANCEVELFPDFFIVSVRKLIVDCCHKINPPILIFVFEKSLSADFALNKKATDNGN